MSDDIKDRVALITGAAKRVGRAVALRMADAGYHIAFTYLSSEADANDLVAQVKAKSRRCVAIRADLTQPESAAAAVQAQLYSQFQRLDLLHNNASLYEPSALAQADVQQMRRFWAIHAESPVLLCKAFEPMLAAAGGCVVNMVDLQVEHPDPNFLTYCASKAALWNLTLGLARAMAPRVRVNGIAPGIVEWAKDQTEAEKQQYLKRVPLARPGTPQDVAEAVLFFCTGGSYVTGQILRLDGGRSIV
jgi:pteridine reductase